MSNTETSPSEGVKTVTGYVYDTSSNTFRIQEVVGVTTAQDPGVFQVRRPNEVTQYAYTPELLKKSDGVFRFVWFDTPSKAIQFARDQASAKRKKLQGQLDLLPTARTLAYVEKVTALS